MKISDKRMKCTEFEDLKVGQIFLYNKEFYMKTTDSYCENNNYDNSVCLSNGELNFFEDNQQVLPVSAELIIT